jgi:hypothetical protein
MYLLVDSSGWVYKTNRLEDMKLYEGLTVVRTSDMKQYDETRKVWVEIDTWER